MNSGVTRRKKCEECTAIAKGTNPHQKNGKLQIPEIILRKKSEPSFCGYIHNLHPFCSKVQCIPSSRIPLESQNKIALF
jgi:hypothetical protein